MCGRRHQPREAGMMTSRVYPIPYNDGLSLHAPRSRSPTPLEVYYSAGEVVMPRAAGYVSGSTGEVYLALGESRHDVGVLQRLFLQQAPSNLRVGDEKRNWSMIATIQSAGRLRHDGCIRYSVFDKAG